MNLRILAVVRTSNDHVIERAVHRILLDHRICGEWFDMSSETMDVIERANLTRAKRFESWARSESKGMPKLPRWRHNITVDADHASTVNYRLGADLPTYIRGV